MKLAAQNGFYRDYGAFTGEVSFSQLRGIVDYAIIGHSERRYVYGEDDKMIAKKVDAAIRNKITPILCIGETESERAFGETADSEHTYGVPKELTENAFLRGATITYHYNDAEDPDDAYVEEIESSGFEFAGWNTEADGTGTAFANRARVAAPTSLWFRTQPARLQNRARRQHRLLVSQKGEWCAIPPFFFDPEEWPEQAAGQDRMKFLDEAKIYLRSGDGGAEG